MVKNQLEVNPNTNFNLTVSDKSKRVLPHIREKRKNQMLSNYFRILFFIEAE